MSEIVHIIAEKGCVKMERGGEPIAALFAKLRGRSLRYLIINGIESEPYLNSERVLLAEKPESILEGAEILQKILGPEKTILAMAHACAEGNEPLRMAAEKCEKKVSLLSTKQKYPQEGSDQLLEAIDAEFGRGSLRDETCFTANIATVFSVYNAVVHNMPVLDRLVTVAGDSVRRPAVLNARIGTPIGDLIEECGGFNGVPERLVIGGPFSGYAVNNLDIPVTKQTSGILALSAHEVRAGTTLPCISCGDCIEACPESLVPTRLFKLINHGEEAEAYDEGLGECISCGSCAYVCPSRIPLAQAFSLKLPEGRERRKSQ